MRRTAGRGAELARRLSRSRDRRRARRKRWGAERARVQNDGRLGGNSRGSARAQARSRSRALLRAPRAAGVCAPAEAQPVELASASEVPQTVAMEEEPLDSVTSETTRMV